MDCDEPLPAYQRILKDRKPSNEQTKCVNCQNEHLWGTARAIVMSSSFGLLSYVAVAQNDMYGPHQASMGFWRSWVSWLFNEILKKWRNGNQCRFDFFSLHASIQESPIKQVILQES